MLSRFGVAGEHLFDLARGSDERTVIPEWEAKSYSHEETFARDRAEPDFLFAVVLDQAARVARLLPRGGGGPGRAVKIATAISRRTRAATIRDATCLAETIYGGAPPLPCGMDPAPRAAWASGERDRRSRSRRGSEAGSGERRRRSPKRSIGCRIRLRLVGPQS
jgi:nucleotidyltransferase/DNA polymerase involved in DNA repair